MSLAEVLYNSVNTMHITISVLSYGLDFVLVISKPNLCVQLKSLKIEATLLL